MKKRDWNLYPYAKLIHLNRERNEKNNNLQKSLPSVISTIKTEIRSVVKFDVIEKYRMLKFKDVRRFFKSLSLAEEKEVSDFLINFYNNKSRHSNNKVNESIVFAHYKNKNSKQMFQTNELMALEKEINNKKQEIEKIRQLFGKLQRQTEEAEIILQKSRMQKEAVNNSVQEEPAGKGINRSKQIADDVMEQLQDNLRLENMRRGF